MSGLLTPDPALREISDLGVIVPGALLHTYVSGTPSTPLATYSDADLAVGHENTNPVVASAGGLFGPIYLTPGVAYKFVLADAAGVTLWTRDPILAPAAVSAPVLVTQGGTGILVGISGGVPYFATTTTMASSALLAAHGVVIGGGAGAAPVTTAAGATGTVLQGVTGADPVFGFHGVLDQQVAVQTVVNSVAETTVYTYAVPANLLGTNKTLHLSLIGDQLNTSGGAQSCTVRVKYGATTIFGATVTGIPSGANRGAILLDLELTAANATGAQRSKGVLDLYDTGEANAGGGTISVADGTGYGLHVGMVHNAIAEDSTAIKNLVVTFQMGNANAAEDMRAHTVYVELK